MKRLFVCLLFLVVFGSAGRADVLNKGDKELAFDLAYSDTDLGSQSGFDFGKEKHTEITFTHGWYLTAHHEIGLLASYLKDEISSSDILVNSKTDALEYGVFYHYNILPDRKASPFFGLSVSGVGGDAGDVYDYAYGARFGIKAYPFDHAGFVGAVVFSKLNGAEDFIPDATSFGVAGGLIFKY